MNGLHHVPGYGPAMIEMRVSDDGAWCCWTQRCGAGSVATVRRRADDCHFLPLSQVDWVGLLATMREARPRNLQGTKHRHFSRLLTQCLLPEDVAQAWAASRPGTSIRRQSEGVLRRLWEHGPMVIRADALALLGGGFTPAAVTAA